MRKILIALVVLFSCNEKESIKNETTTASEKIVPQKSKEDSNVKGNLILNSRLVIDYSEGYPILRDVSNNDVLLDFHPVLGEVTATKIDNNTYNFSTKTTLPDSKGEFVKCSPVNLSVAFSKSDYKCTRNPEKENIPQYTPQEILEVKDKLRFFSEKNISDENAIPYEEFITFQGQLIVAALNGDKAAYSLFERLSQELPEEYFLGESDESYDQFKSLYQVCSRQF